MTIGIDIGGTKTIAGTWDEAGKLRLSAKQSTPERASLVPDFINDLVHQLAGDEPLDHIGIGVAAPLNLERSVILNPANLSWHNYPLADKVAEMLGQRPTVYNDAACGAYSEALTGAGKDYKRVLYLAIGTGIGTGLVDSGLILQGTHNLEGGHMTIDKDGPECGCGGHGHLEALVSGRAIKRRFGKLAYEITDPSIWEEYSYDLAIGISSLISVLSPDVVVLGGGVSVHYALFRESLDRHLAALKQPYALPPVVAAAASETAVVRGALMLASKASIKA